MDLACERNCLAAGCLTTGVMQGVRALSTRTLYESKWKVFHKWCSELSVVVMSFTYRGGPSCRAGSRWASLTLRLKSTWLRSRLAMWVTMANASWATSRPGLRPGRFSGTGTSQWLLGAYVSFLLSPCGLRT